MSRGILGGAETNLSSTTGLSPGRAWACPHKRGGSVHFQGCEAHKGGAPSYKGGGGRCRCMGEHQHETGQAIPPPWVLRVCGHD